jgi:translation initiation factor 3 subunit M
VTYTPHEDLLLISGQVQELVDYVARGSTEDERAAVLQSFQDIVKTDEGAKPVKEDEERRRHALTLVLDQTKSLGDGSEQGACGNQSIVHNE